MSEPFHAGNAVILVVEDEQRLIHLIQTILGTQSYSVVVASDGERAVQMAALESPDLVLLDILLPGEMDGFTVCQRIREFSPVPIIMLTARAREHDKLRGFELGADDYITKPFSAKELLARVRAVLRRSQAAAAQPARLEFGDLVIDPAAQRVVVRGQDVALTPTEYRLLLALARHPGHVIPHGSLLTDVWGSEYRDEIDYLRTYIRYLRQKIEVDPAQPRYLLTRPGLGYLLSDEL